MEYKIDIYEKDKDNLFRFALGSLSERTLFVLVQIQVRQMTKHLT